MAESREPTVTWSDIRYTSYQDIIYGMLEFFERDIEESGWDQAPLLGVVHGQSLVGTGALSVAVPEFGDTFYGNFEPALMTLSKQVFEAEIRNLKAEQTFLNGAVNRGFQGWLFSAEFLTRRLGTDKEPESEEYEQRLTIFVDLDNERYGLYRNRGDTEATRIQVMPKMPFIRCLSLLNSASIISLVRRDLEEEDEPE